MPIQTVSQAFTNEGVGGFSFRNKIINGGMEIDQRLVGSALTVSDSYTLDRWSAYENTDGSFTVQRSTDAPTGFVNSLLASITGADSSLSSNQQMIPCRQWLEGTMIEDLAWGTANAKPITVSFWVKSSITGTYGFTITNDAGDRVYGQTYTISAANTWEYKTATISGPTGGTWPTNNGRGAIITWSLGAGSGLTIASNGSWITPASASVVYAVVGQTNVVATNGASWQITGVQLETGSVATSFENRPYSVEFILCQRYYQKSFPQSMAPGVANFQGTIRLHAAGGGGTGVDAYSGWHVSFTGGKMRPGVSVTTYSSAAANQVTYLRDNGSTVNGSHGGSVGVEHGFNLFGSYAGSGSVGTTRSLYFDYIADAEL